MYLEVCKWSCLYITYLGCEQLCKSNPIQKNRDSFDCRFRLDCNLKNRLSKFGLPLSRHMARLDWIGLDWIGLDWIGLDWIGLDWIGLDWIGLDWIGLDWIGLIYCGLI